MPLWFLRWSEPRPRSGVRSEQMWSVSLYLSSSPPLTFNQPENQPLKRFPLEDNSGSYYQSRQPVFTSLCWYFTLLEWVCHRVTYCCRNNYRGTLEDFARCSYVFFRSGDRCFKCDGIRNDAKNVMNELSRCVDQKEGRVRRRVWSERGDGIRESGNQGARKRERN